MLIQKKQCLIFFPENTPQKTPKKVSFLEEITADKENSKGRAVYTESTVKSCLKVVQLNGD